MVKKKRRRTLLLTIHEMNNKETALEVNENNKDKIDVAVVTVCLTSSHSECTGVYEDSLSGRYVVRCICRCGHLPLSSNKNNTSTKLVKPVGDQPTSRTRSDLTQPAADTTAF